MQVVDTPKHKRPADLSILPQGIKDTPKRLRLNTSSGDLEDNPGEFLRDIRQLIVDACDREAEDKEDELQEIKRKIARTKEEIKADNKLKRKQRLEQEMELRTGYSNGVPIHNSLYWLFQQTNFGKDCLGKNKNTKHANTEAILNDFENEKTKTIKENKKENELTNLTEETSKLKSIERIQQFSPFQISETNITASNDSFLNTTNAKIQESDGLFKSNDNSCEQSEQDITHSKMKLIKDGRNIPFSFPSLIDTFPRFAAFYNQPKLYFDISEELKQERRKMARIIEIRRGLSTGDKPTPYKDIKSNIFVCRKRRVSDEVPMCNCVRVEVDKSNLNKSSEAGINQKGMLSDKSEKDNKDESSLEKCQEAKKEQQLCDQTDIKAESKVANAQIPKDEQLNKEIDSSLADSLNPQETAHPQPSPKPSEISATRVANCEEGCMNRGCFIECDPKQCRCGELCQNQRFQRHQYAKVKMMKTDGRGWGLFAEEDLSPGQFVIEYTGEVIDLEMLKKRLLEYDGESNFYFLSLGGNEFIDASRKGSRARFINHSCEPLCVTQKWTVLGEECVGVFVGDKMIKKGTELTMDYQWESVSSATLQKCRCGSAKCRGYLQKIPPSTTGTQTHSTLQQQLGDFESTTDGTKDKIPHTPPLSPLSPVTPLSPALQPEIDLTDSTNLTMSRPPTTIRHTMPIVTKVHPSKKVEKETEGEAKKEEINPMTDAKQKKIKKEFLIDKHKEKSIFLNPLLLSIPNSLDAKDFSSFTETLSVKQSSAFEKIPKEIPDANLPPFPPEPNSSQSLTFEMPTHLLLRSPRTPPVVDDLRNTRIMGMAHCASHLHSRFLSRNIRTTLVDRTLLCRDVANYRVFPDGYDFLKGGEIILQELADELRNRERKAWEDSHLDQKISDFLDEDVLFLSTRKKKYTKT
ncbi:putative histone-lysine n-methyltransferase ashh1 [Monocercomonoides exilis]|uniref:putative histone-lysine n-methyltransferase ashh1 n=1 Tax=Monocercomonoides exilis TaxID=2049356 RepID=UPI0035596309|nr:putative histone-lysine n-methyltransferase ashh1 [Monocercomonoides exilis]|eukprot:MONOS_480.1-p1 / transcript=MONOS_480.1 / gene=MONOS_480 / organism=Monocercomonoides_exilis_PA203 / gene_product=Os02g0554000 / transcript_product=Os02g0554000 / location=Mono_scaffold00007:246982-250375(+) / protein_length=918 / sequence_SO=supercontig / SO=protein_coding / is_pseudo=false